ncbi:MAG: hypothetical protein KAS32_06305 [Candidatus Peribacteraceae bacterium]|nr:hypothetical protein [Candidatus Peribacteraceae bacterium]
MIISALFVLATYFSFDSSFQTLFFGATLGTLIFSLADLIAGDFLTSKSRRTQAVNSLISGGASSTPLVGLVGLIPLVPISFDITFGFGMVIGIAVAVVIDYLT